MKIYNELILLNNRIRLDGKEYDCTLGKHCIWAPEIESKFILSLNGRIESTAWERGRNKDLIISHEFFSDNVEDIMDSLVNEYHIFAMLEQAEMSPPVNGYIRVDKFKSCIFYEDYCDERGLWGYSFADANKLPKGKWNFDVFKSKFVDTGIIEASPGALGDLRKDDNIVNGYLVDIRRTIWDMIKLKR